MNSNAVKRKYQKCVDRMKNMKKKPEFHGSDLEKIADYYHLNKENIILFGANVNPLGLSGQVKKDLAEHLDIISSYPDRDYTDLKKAIAAYTNTSPEHIVVGNGSTELISLLISQRAPKRALLLGPTYSEYARDVVRPSAQECVQNGRARSTKMRWAVKAE